MVRPFLGPLLDGIKTIESRFSRARRAPYGVLGPGDIVAVKRPGGPVVGAFHAGQVHSYQVTPGLMDKIRARFGKEIQAWDDQLWDDRAGRRRFPAARSRTGRTRCRMCPGCRTASPFPGA
jgi:hypothetical protein